jgi:hypothetical protein
MKQLKTFFTVCLLFLSLAGTVKSQTAADLVFSVSTDGLQFVSAKQVNFNVYLKNIWSTQIQLGGISLGYDFNNNILNNGTGTLSIVSSGLPLNIQPKGPAVLGGNKLAVASATPPGAGSGYYMNPGDSVLVVKLSLSTSSPTFANSTLTLFYRTSLTPRFVFSIYVGTANIGLTSAQTMIIGSSFNTPLPVTLASFSANVESKRDVKLSWTTVAEQNNRGFEIERKTTDGNWIKIGFSQGQGNKNTATNYLFEDKKLNAGKYNYRLKQIDNNGNFEYHNLNNAVDIGIPSKYDLSQNYPNPFNPSTSIDFDLPFDSRVSIVLFDITGKEIMTLLNEQRKAGYHTALLNCSSLSSGTYFYRLNADGNGQKFSLTKKLMLVK